MQSYDTINSARDLIQKDVSFEARGHVPKCVLLHDLYSATCLLYCDAHNISTIFPNSFVLPQIFKTGPGPEVEAFDNNHDCCLESQSGMQMNGECCPNSKRRATACKDYKNFKLFSKLSSLSP